MDHNLAALLTACRDAPEDDLPRLALADWCLEQPDPALQARGEFIRGQVRLSHLLSNDSERAVLAQQAKELELRHRRAWLGEMRSRTHRCEFERGLLAVEVSGGTLAGAPLDVLAKLSSWPWVIRLVGRNTGTRELAALADSPALAGIACLQFDGGSLDSHGIRLLAASARPRVLGLARCQLDDRALGELAESACLDRVTTLNLSFNRFGNAGLARLVASSHAGSLTSLNLGNNRLGLGGAQALARSDLLARLTVLELCDNDLTDRGMQALVKGQAETRLFSLGLRHNEIGTAGVRALTRWPGVSRLQSLDLAVNHISYHGALLLADSDHLDNLITLVLDHNPIHDGGARILATAPALPRLAWLSLLGCRLSYLARNTLSAQERPRVLL
jgi:uncharacterized protein (TIGR02996 family)